MNHVWKKKEVKAVSAVSAHDTFEGTQANVVSEYPTRQLYQFIVTNLHTTRSGMNDLH